MSSALTTSSPVPPPGWTTWESSMLAVERVRQRLVKATTALENAGILYAVAGGNAVAAWVGQVDASAIRTTQDVYVLIRRADLPAAITVMESAGFVYRHVAGMDVFLDGAGAKARDAVHLVFAGEKVRPHETASNPDVMDSEQASEGFRILSLQALVQIKLTAYRDKDRVHLRDMIAVGLIDATWIPRLPPDLATRLQTLLDDPEG